MRKEALDFPKSILIETLSLCQGACKFCPYTELRKGKKKEELSVNKFAQLIEELSHYEVKRITLFNNNEPLLDNRIYSFISLTKKLLPNVEITLSTNGVLLSEVIIKKLNESGLTTLYVSIPCIDRDNYKKTMGIYPDKIFALLDNIKIPDIFQMIRIAVPHTKYMDLDQIRKRFNNFSICDWKLEYKKNWNIDKKFFEVAEEVFYTGPCDRPMDQMVISANGNALICCRDWLEENVVGNVYKDTLYKIWHSERMKEIQKKIGNQDYDDIKCCSFCSMNKNFILPKND